MGADQSTQEAHADQSKPATVNSSDSGHGQPMVGAAVPEREAAASSRSNGPAVESTQTHTPSHSRTDHDPEHDHDDANAEVADQVAPLPTTTIAVHAQKGRSCAVCGFAGTASESVEDHVSSAHPSPRGSEDGSSKPSAQPDAGIGELHRSLSARQLADEEAEVKRQQEFRAQLDAEAAKPRLSRSNTQTSLPRFRSLVRLNSGISVASSQLQEMKVSSAEQERQKRERLKEDVKQEILRRTTVADPLERLELQERLQRIRDEEERMREEQQRQHYQKAPHWFNEEFRTKSKFVKQQVQLSRGVTTFYLRYPRKKLNKYHNPYAPPGLAGEWPPPEDATAAAAPTDTASLYEEADSGATQKREIDQRQRAEARLLLEEKIERFKRSRMMFHRFAEGDKLAHALGNDGRPLGYKPKFNKPRTKGNVLDAIVMDGTVPSSLDPMKYKKGKRINIPKDDVFLLDDSDDESDLDYNDREEDKSDDELYDSYVVDPTMDPHVHVVSISSETSYKPKKLGQDEEKDVNADSGPKLTGKEAERQAKRDWRKQMKEWEAREAKRQRKQQKIETELQKLEREKKELAKKQEKERKKALKEKNKKRKVRVNEVVTSAAGPQPAAASPTGQGLGVGGLKVPRAGGVSTQSTTTAGRCSLTK